MEVFVLANVAITLALLIFQLLDFVTELDRGSLSRCKEFVLNAESTDAALSPAAQPDEQYDRAA